MDLLSWKDFMALDDSAPIDETIKLIDKLKLSFKDTVDSIAKDSSRLGGEYAILVSEAKKLQKELSTVNVDMKEAPKAIEDTTKATDKLADSVAKNTTAQKENAKATEQVEAASKKLATAKDQLLKGQATELGSLEALKKQLDQTTKSYHAMGDATDQAVKESTLKRINELSVEYLKGKKVIDDAKKSVLAAAGSYNELSARVLEAKKELMAMEGGAEGNSQAFKKLQKEVAEGTEKLKAWDKAIGDNKRNVGNYPEEISMIGGAFDKAIPGASGQLEGMTKLLGSSKVALLGVAGAAVALGKAFYDEGKRVQKNLETTNTLTNLTGRELEVLTAKIGASAKVFDKEYNEVLKASNVLIQSFGISGEEAVDAINQAMLRGVDINSDFLEQFSEYAPFLATAGASTQDFVDILLASEQAGVFSDKGLDTIKEATLRIREMTPATVDAMKGLGLSVDQIQKGLRDGTTTVIDVIKQVSTRMNELPPISAEVGTAIADIFGGPGEDAAQFLFQLGSINKTQGDWTESLTGSYKAQYELLQATEEYEQVLISTSGNFNAFEIQFDTFITNVKTRGLEILANLANAFTTLDERVGEYKKSIETVENQQTLINEIKRLEEQLESGTSWTTKFANSIRSGGNGLRFMALEAEAQTEVLTKLGLAKQALIDLAARQAEEDAKEDPAKVIANAKAAIDAAKKVRDAEYELYKFRMEEAIKAQELIYQNEANLESKRLAAVTKAQSLRNSLFQKQKEHELDEEGLLQAEITLIGLEAEARRNENIRKSLEERRNIKIQELEFQRSLNETIYQDESQNFEDRVQALFDFGTLSQQILDTQLSGKLISQEEYNATVLSNEKSLTDQLIAMQIARVQKEADIVDIKNDTSSNNELALINEQYAQQLLSTEEYLSRKEKLEQDSRNVRLLNEIEFLKEQKAILEAGNQDTLLVDQAIAAARAELSSTSAEDRLAFETELQNALRELAAQTFMAAADIANSAFEAEQQRLAIRMDSLTEWKENELLLAGDNEARKAEILAEFARKEEDLKRKQNEQARKQAIFNKAAAVFEIGVSTAKGIAAQLPGFPLTAPLMAIIGAIGALQIAAVLARPIPAFAEGTDNAPGGLAIINELGPELIEDRSGKMKIINTDGPTLANISAGSRVYTAKETQRILNSPMAEEMMHSMQGDTRDLTVISEQRHDRELARVFNDGFESLEYTLKRTRTKSLSPSDLRQAFKDALKETDYKNSFK